MSGQRIIHLLRHTNGKVKGDCFSLMSEGELIKVKTEK